MGEIDSFKCVICGGHVEETDYDYKERNMYWKLKEIHLCEQCARTVSSEFSKWLQKTFEIQLEMAKRLIIGLQEWAKETAKLIEEKVKEESQ